MAQAEQGVDLWHPRSPAVAQAMQQQDWAACAAVEVVVPVPLVCEKRHDYLLILQLHARQDNLTLR
jgi:hypothetical protein